LDESISELTINSVPLRVKEETLAPKVESTVKERFPTSREKREPSCWGGTLCAFIVEVRKQRQMQKGAIFIGPFIDE
jgi:hypothetical protein